MADDWDDDDDMDDLFFLSLFEQEEARRQGSSSGSGCLTVLVGLFVFVGLAVAAGPMLL